MEMPNDVLTLVSRVASRAMEKSGYVTPAMAGGLADGPGAEMLIDTLASHLLTFLGLGGPGHAAPPPAAATVDWEHVCAEQMARNSALARALGACDCWGELAGCEVCRGSGASGWRPPDRVAFDALVRPVLRKLRQHRGRVHRAAALAL